MKKPMKGKVNERVEITSKGEGQMRSLRAGNERVEIPSKSGGQMRSHRAGNDRVEKEGG